ncbi:MAG: PEP-CTERM sorting domain-containing protein [Verrucomicrobiota bacterium]
MRKRSVIKPVCSGLAILAGSFSFMGSAQAITLLSENFEGASNLFGVGTYNYSQNYTMPNLLVPAGGLKYMNGGPGTTGSVSTSIFTATGSPLSLLTGGITGAQIDSGSITYNLYAQFSTYRQQNDNGTLSVQFLDAGSNPLGAALTIGGATFVSALGSGNNGSYADARDWGADSLAGIVPSGARFATVQILETKTAAGTAIDGYMDNINVSIAVVPEPGSVALLALGGGLVAWARRRR